MNTEQDGSCQRITSQSAKELLAKISLEFRDWAAVAFNSAGRFFTAIFNVFILAIAAITALFAVMVLTVRDTVTNPSDDSMLTLFNIRTLSKKTRAASASDYTNQPAEGVERS